MKKIPFDTDVPAQFRAIPQHIAMTILEAIHRYAATGAARSLTVEARYPASSRASSDSALANTGCFSKKPLSPSRSTASPTAATLTAEPRFATQTESAIPLDSALSSRTLFFSETLGHLSSRFSGVTAVKGEASVSPFLVYRES